MPKRDDSKERVRKLKIMMVVLVGVIVLTVGVLATLSHRGPGF